LVDFRVELITPRRRRSVALGAAALLVLAISAAAWLWPQLPKPYRVPPPGPVQVLAAQFDSSQSGWVALRSGVGPLSPTGIYRTPDGGRTWLPLPVPVRTPSAGSLRFFDAREGILELVRDEADGRTALFGTVDGGGTWQARALPRSRSGDAALFFADPNHGFEVFRPSGSAATLVSRTTDGGRTWVDAAMAGLPTPPIGLIGLGFVDAVRGFAVAGGSIYRTIDAGDFWTRAATGFHVDRIGAVAVPIAFGATVMIAMENLLFVSNDAGASFAELRELPFDIREGGLSCADAAHCRAAPRGYYAVSDDGGATWVYRPARLPNALSLGPVQAVDAATSWSVVSAAQGQRLFMTRDGGATWRQLPLPRL
jgi:photosystem II stability/assembly factor-like uncharacterized protein